MRARSASLSRLVRRVRFPFFEATRTARSRRAASKTPRQPESVLRIGFRKIPKKLAVASGDRAKSEFSRKYFYCQNSRLRVRETSFLATAAICLNSQSLRCALCCDERNNCGTGISLNRDMASRERFVRTMQCRVDAFRCLRSAFASRVAPCT